VSYKTDDLEVIGESIGRVSQHCSKSITGSLID